MTPEHIKDTEEQVRQRNEINTNQEEPPRENENVTTEETAELNAETKELEDYSQEKYPGSDSLILRTDRHSKK